MNNNCVDVFVNPFESELKKIMIADNGYLSAFGKKFLILSCLSLLFGILKLILGSFKKRW